MRTGLVALTFGALALVACGDDDSGSPQIQTDPEGVVDRGDDLDDGDAGPGSSGPSGSGVAVIGDETFEFEVECLFAPETGNPDGILAIQGTGEDDLTVEVSSRHSDADDPDAPPWDHIGLKRGDEWYTALNMAAGGQAGFLEIDGRAIRATTQFIDEFTTDRVDGTFEATCP